MGRDSPGWPSFSTGAKLFVCAELYSLSTPAGGLTTTFSPSPALIPPQGGGMGVNVGGVPDGLCLKEEEGPPARDGKLNS